MLPAFSNSKFEIVLGRLVVEIVQVVQIGEVAKSRLEAAPTELMECWSVSDF